MKKLLLTAVLSTSMIVAQSYPFVGGESLSYEVSLNILSAGNAILKINDLPEPSGTPLYLITFHMRTNSLWDQIFPIRDTVESWVDKKALITRKLKKAIHERTYSQDLTAEFDYDSGTVTTNRTSLSIENEVRDPYSFFYYLRTLPLKVGDLFDFTIFDNHRFTNLKMIVHRKESVRVTAGQFDCFVVEPFREGRTLFKNRGDMKVWISDDRRRLPVMIVSKARFGSLVMKLTDHSR
ncbi:MAG: DUF3108 domain-containing protein [Candidatus Neomarinimicrobiota bacterium]|nr:DUF3108 domain-containing protein [Candidatus Neomarinimicrobiota bacterium]